MHKVSEVLFYNPMPDRVRKSAHPSSAATGYRQLHGNPSESYAKLVGIDSSVRDVMSMT